MNNEEQNENIRTVAAIVREKTTLQIVQRIAHALVDAVKALPAGNPPIEDPSGGEGEGDNDPSNSVEQRILEHLHGIIDIVEMCYAPDPDEPDPPPPREP